MRFLVYDRLLGIGDDYWIEDDQGNKVFLVDGKAMRLRDTWELKDPRGACSSTSTRRCSPCATRW